MKSQCLWNKGLNKKHGHLWGTAVGEHRPAPAAGSGWSLLLLSPPQQNKYENKNKNKQTHKQTHKTAFAQNWDSIDTFVYAFIYIQHFAVLLFILGAAKPLILFETITSIQAVGIHTNINLMH